MTLNDVLLSLLEAISNTGETHIVRWDDVQRWPEGTLGYLLKTGLLTQTAPAQSIECKHCEYNCLLDIHHIPAENGLPERTFVVCEEPDMQSQMGRIQIPLEQLQQWKLTYIQLAKVVADLLSIEGKVEDRHGQSNIRIGMIKHKNGRRWLSLNKSPLTLEINDHHLPLEEVLFFEENMLTIDKARIEQLIDKAPANKGKKYTPSTEKREARKRQTEAMHRDWQDAYLELRQKHPSTTTHSDTWVAGKIAEMEISQGRSAARIRRIMKN